MRAYYGDPIEWFLSDHFKAAHNALVAAQTRDLLSIDQVSAAFARSASYIAKLGREPTALSSSKSMCFLAQAFAESDVYGAALTPDGSIKRLCWHRVKDIRTACDTITQEDIDSVRRSLLRFPGVVV
jgi:hypothetical protein